MRPASWLRPAGEFRASRIADAARHCRRRHRQHDEWYDFAVYGFFAAILGRQFFPAEDPLSSLLAAFGVFAAGYLMRPFGSIVFGHIGDRVGRKPVLLVAVIGLLDLSYPLFWLMHHPATAMIMLGQLGFSVILGLYLGTLPAMVVEIFPRRVRCSAMSISYNAAIGLFGGTAPMVARLPHRAQPQRPLARLLPDGDGRAVARRRARDQGDRLVADAVRRPQRSRCGARSSLRTPTRARFAGTALPVARAQASWPIPAEVWMP
jgi:hypothetical protein